MASINGITLKAVKRFRGHDGEPCYQGNVYIGTKKIGFWGGDKEGYRTAFHMAWPAVMESFFISFAVGLRSNLYSISLPP